ncbi:MAG: hypothetical protein ACXVEF_13195 [Polyangiales bacterium]
MRPALAIVLTALGCGSSDPPSEVADSEVAETSATDVGSDVPHDHQVDVSFEAGAYDGPKTLAETGLYSDPATKTVAASVVAYDVRYPLWSDGLEKSRFLSIPAGSAIDTSDPDAWSFPVGTKIWKEFRLGTRRIETRYLEKRASGWLRITFGWDASESTATAMPDGAVDFGGTTHDLPDRETCDRCHVGRPEGVLGIGTIQLSPSLADWSARGLLSKPVAPKDPPGTGATQEVLAYFHGNCGVCHNDAGVWSKATGLRLDLKTTDTTPELTGAYTTTIGKDAHHVAPGALDKVIVAGDPDKSQLWFRMGQRDAIWQMPPVGTEVVDDVAVAKVRAWILGLK